MKVRVVVGMEVHVQLRTKSKMFCRCAVRFGAPPNTLVCPVCLGLPGALPVPNREAMLMALTMATALGCEIPEVTGFDRKHYFYPDLPKGYQISQYDWPLGTGGSLRIEVDGATRDIRIRRLHLEEDAGKSLHETGDGSSRVDLNRTGTPLVEIVTEPDLASPGEARAYLQELLTLVRYVDISDANMQEGNLRCEPSINLHILHAGQRVVTPIVEVKNLNSMRNVERALKYEIERQLAEYKEKGAVVTQGRHATRGFDDERGVTFLMRVKEAEHDYRYFPEPDIPPIVVGPAWREESESRVPELPVARRARFDRDYQLSDYDVDQLCRERTTADYFERTVAAGSSPKPAANWILTDLARHANERHVAISDLGIPPERLAALILLIEQGGVPRQAARQQVLPRMLDTGAEPDQIVTELGLATVDDADLLREAAQRAIAAYPRAVADVRAGKTKALGALMGFVMKETGGKANPDVVQSVLKQILEIR